MLLYLVAERQRSETEIAIRRLTTDKATKALQERIGKLEEVTNALSMRNMHK